MSFWKSDLLKKLEGGELPTVETNNKVSIDTNSLVVLGVVLVSVAAVVALFVVLVRKPKEQ